MRFRVVLIVSVLFLSGALSLRGGTKDELSAGHGPQTMRSEAERAYGVSRLLGARLFQSRIPPLSGNGLSCSGCHVHGRLVSVYRRYPRYDRGLGRFVALEEQVSTCISRRMAGRDVAAGSRSMVALLVHLKELSALIPER